jgi:hypothetical protein
MIIQNLRLKHLIINFSLNIYIFWLCQISDIDLDLNYFKNYINFFKFIIDYVISLLLIIEIDLNKNLY